MAIHIVKQGECLSSLAARYGLTGWAELYDDPANTPLRKKRPNPNILAPGDQVVVPDRAPGKSYPIATGRTHGFRVEIQKVRLRIALVNRSGKPYPGKRYLINIAGGEISGNTKPDGMIEVEVPATEVTGRLRAWLFEDGADAVPTIDRELSIGHIDPIDTTSGVQGRLSNLGYRCPIADDPNAPADDRLLSAVRSFRAKYGLPEVEAPKGDAGQTGDGDEEAPESSSERLIDADFRNKLASVYERSVKP